METEELTIVIDSIKPAVYSLLLVVIGLGFIYRITTWFLQNRRDQQIEANKEARAQRYNKSQTDIAKSLESLSGATNRLIDLHKTHAAQIENTFDSLHKGIDKVNVGLRELTDFHTRVMTLDDSLRLVDHYTREFIRDTQDIIARCMQEGSFLARRDFVSRKVRTLLADLCDTLLSRLQDYNLSIDPTDFISTYNTWTEENSVGAFERFYLVDKVWSDVEPILENEQVSIDERIEEMRLVVLNSIVDHFGSVAKRIRESRKDRTDKFLRQQESA